MASLRNITWRHNSKALLLVSRIQHKHRLAQKMQISLEISGKKQRVTCDSLFCATKLRSFLVHSFWCAIFLMREAPLGIAKQRKYLFGKGFEIFCHWKCQKITCEPIKVHHYDRESNIEGQLHSRQALLHLQQFIKQGFSQWPCLGASKMTRECHRMCDCAVFWIFPSKIITSADWSGLTHFFSKKPSKRHEKLWWGSFLARVIPAEVETSLLWFAETSQCEAKKLECATSEANLLQNNKLLLSWENPFFFFQQHNQQKIALQPILTWD